MQTRTSYILFILYTLFLSLLSAQSLTLDIVHIQPKKPTDSGHTSYDLVFHNYTTTDLLPWILTEGEAFRLPAIGLLVSIPSVCQGFNASQALDARLYDRDDLIVLWETQQDCSLSQQLSQLLGYTHLKGILVWNSKDVLPKDSSLSAFPLPVFSIDAHYAGKLMHIPQIFMPSSPSVSGNKSGDNTGTHTVDQGSLYMLSVTMLDDEYAEPELWRFSLGLISVLLCASFIFSLLLNYYFYENQRSREMDRSWRSSELGSSLETSRIVSRNLESLFPVKIFNKAGLNQEKKRKEQVFGKMTRNLVPMSSVRNQENDSVFVGVDLSDTTLLNSKNSTTSFYSIKSITSEMDPNKSVELCPICLEIYQDGDKLRELTCLHWFHVDCIDEWFKKGSPTCPLCNMDFD